MATPMFFQESRVGDAVFEISDGHLSVSIKELGERRKVRIALRTLDPNYQIGFRSFPSTVALYLAVAVVFGAIGWALLRIDSIPWVPRIYLVYLPFLFAGVSLAQAIRFTPKLESVDFNDHWGHPAVIILRERKQSAECMAFVDALVANIELVQSDLSAEAREAVMKELKLDPAFAASAPVVMRKWVLAIVLGALAALLPLIPGANIHLDLFMFLLVFSFCTGAVTLAVVSITGREPGRWFGLVAIALAVIPVLFY